LEKRQVVVIGAGLGGLSAAALLAKKGIPVLVVEESSEAGGRAKVIVKDGFTLEYGVHSFRYAQKSSAHKIMSGLGLEPEWIKEDHPNWMIRGKDLYAVPGPRGELWGGERQLFSQAEVDKVREPITNLLSQPSEKWFRKSVAEYLGQLLQDEKARLLVELMCFQLMEPDPRHLSAGELIIHLQRVLETGAAAGQLKGGSKVLIERMVSAVKEGRGEIKFHTRALALEIEKGRVKSVNTSEGEIEAQAVVYAGALSQFFFVAGPEHFPEKWIKKVKRLAPVSGVAIDFGLREKVSDILGWMIEPELKIMGKFPSNLDPGLAPEGKQLSSWLIVMQPEKMSDPEAVRTGIHKLRSQIKRVFPDFFAVTEWERILALPVIDSAALNYKQSFLDRPSIQAPGIENLFFAGDGVAAAGASGEIALASGIEACEKVAAYLGKG